MLVIVMKCHYVFVVKVQARPSGPSLSREVIRDSCRVITIKADDKSRRPGRHQALIVEV